MTRILKSLVLLLALFALGGCIGLVGPEVPEPASVGTFAVGVTTITVEDPSRDRELPVEIWYPASGAAATDDDDSVIYSVHALGGTVARLRSPARARRDAEARTDLGPYPVVLMSHGSGSTRFGNVTLCEILASHGFIVAAPDHIGHTVDDQVFGISDDARARTTLDRPLDLSRILDALQHRSHDSRFVLSGAVDMTRVAVAGHSFGGTTALGMVGAQFDAPRQKKECEMDDSDRRCRVVPVLGPKPYRYRDPRIGAAILIAPGGYDLYRADGVGYVDAPTLVVAGMKDEGNKFAEYPKPIYDALKTPRHLLKLRDAGHLTMTDVCEIGESVGVLTKAFGGKDAVDGCGGRERGYISSRVANDLVANAMLAFLDLYLNHDPSAAKALELALSPELDRVVPEPKTVAKISAH
ncbi:MAG: hypothetical protein HOV80_15180 [Polyangiaceae bacterium]|nr:hypothetical protein [Polyangiaceae bacterium]